MVGLKQDSMLMAVYRNLFLAISIKVARDFWLVVTLKAKKIARLLTYRHYKINRDPQIFP